MEPSELEQQIKECAAKGNHAKALNLADAYHRLVAERHGQLSVEVAYGLNIRGMLNTHAQRLPNAQKDFEEAVDILEKFSEAEALRNTCRQNLARVAEQLAAARAASQPPEASATPEQPKSVPTSREDRRRDLERDAARAARPRRSRTAPPAPPTPPPRPPAAPQGGTEATATTSGSGTPNVDRAPQVPSGQFTPDLVRLVRPATHAEMAIVRDRVKAWAQAGFGEGPRADAVLAEMRVTSVDIVSVINVAVSETRENRSVEERTRILGPGDEFAQRTVCLQDVDPWSVPMNLDALQATSDEYEVPGSGTARACRQCRKKRFVTCRRCSGKGEVPCYHCGATGHVTCPACDGSGRTDEGKCELCRGDGRIGCMACREVYVDTQTLMAIRSGQPYDMRRVQFASSTTSRPVTCPDCEGEGKVICDACDGRGRVYHSIYVTTNRTVQDRSNSVYGDPKMPDQEDIGAPTVELLQHRAQNVAEAALAPMAERVSQMVTAVGARLAGSLGKRRITSQALTITGSARAHLTYEYRGETHEMWFDHRARPHMPSSPFASSEDIIPALRVMMERKTRIDRYTMIGVGCVLVVLALLLWIIWSIWAGGIWLVLGGLFALGVWDDSMKWVYDRFIDDMALQQGITAGGITPRELLRLLRTNELESLVDLPRVRCELPEDIDAIKSKLPG